MNTEMDIVILYSKKESVEFHPSSLSFHMTFFSFGFLKVFFFMLNERKNQNVDDDEEEPINLLTLSFGKRGG